MTPPALRERVVVDLHGFAHGGAAVGRLPDGLVCFVPGAIPGERVEVAIVERRKRWARARVLHVLEPSPDRVVPPCALAAAGRCGGCSLQHIAPARQRDLKRRVVVEQLQRIGGISDPPVPPTVAVADSGYRTTARFAVDRAGRLGFRAPASHDVVAVDRCLVLSPELQRLLHEAGDGWAGADEVTLRAGDDTASAAADGTVVRGPDAVTVTVDGTRFRVSAGSFFQAGPQAAAVLARQVRRAAQAAPGDRAADLYAGVGLFAWGLAADGADVTAVESNPDACADARANLPDEVTVVQGDVGDALRAWRGRLDLVVLDPPRAGAGPAVVEQLVRLRARRIVYVSCDPAALARDARALVAGGWELVEAVPVDQFAHTHHVETIATFLRRRR